MRVCRRHFIISLLSALGTSASASQGSYSLKDRARWKSFGVEDWVVNDPFERASPGAKREPYSSWSLARNESRTDQILALIGFAEAGKLQYDAVHVSARKRPQKRPTEMTVGEVFYWIKKTPGQQHAIGRYQFIPSTLLMLTDRASIGVKSRFNQALQDKLGVMLLKDAGYDDFLNGKITLSKFMDNLAWIWAGLPLHNGKSAYRGIAGNRATISRSFYADQMQRIFS